MSPNDAARFAWGAWVLSWLVAALWSGRVERRSRSAADAAYRVLTGVGAILLFDVHPLWPWAVTLMWRPTHEIGWMLVTVTIAGFGVAWWARIALGRMWSSGVTRKVDHEIVTRGPYGVVRHPIYSGILLAVLATASMRGTSGALLGAAAMVAGLFVKARVEERFLRLELGEDRYSSYARRVPMLVPFIR
jgi:protein-S-isoprenylcysteine O-methyltransferase Ste14